MHSPELVQAAVTLAVTLPALDDPNTAPDVFRAWQAGPLKAAWKAAAREHHPDRGGSPERFKALSAAYELLRTAEVRVAAPPPDEHPFIREALRRAAAAAARVRREREAQRAHEAKQQAEAAAQRAALERRAAELRAREAELLAARAELEAQERRVAQREVEQLRRQIQEQREEHGVPAAPRPPRPPRPKPLAPEEVAAASRTALDLLGTALDIGSALGVDRALGVQQTASKLRKALRR